MTAALDPRAGVRQALALDRRSMETSSMGFLLLVVPVTGMAAWFGWDTLGAILVLTWGFQAVSAAWNIDKTGGARLRETLGVPRATVVSARFVYAVAAVTALGLTTAVCLAGFGLLFGRDIADPVAQVLLFTAATVAVPAVAAPVRIRFGTLWWVVALFIAMVAVLGLALGGARLLVGDNTTVWHFSAAGMGVAVLTAVVTVPIALRITQRVYDRKDF